MLDTRLVRDEKSSVQFLFTNACISECSPIIYLTSRTEVFDSRIRVECDVVGCNLECGCTLVLDTPKTLNPATLKELLSSSTCPFITLRGI